MNGSTVATAEMGLWRVAALGGQVWWVAAGSAEEAEQLVFARTGARWQLRSVARLRDNEGLRLGRKEGRPVVLPGRLTTGSALLHAADWVETAGMPRVVAHNDHLATFGGKEGA